MPGAHRTGQHIPAVVHRVLVIRLGALGDFIHSFAPFQAIRQAHPEAHITLLTTRPFMELARSCPWFDTVVQDDRPRWSNPRRLLALRHFLQGFDRVYDLQTSGRTAWYCRLAGKPAEWSGHVRGPALAHGNPWRDAMHTRARQRDQLRMAGLETVPEPDMDWLLAQARLTPSSLGLELPYALLVPGASPGHPAKCWPARRYGELAAMLAERGIRPVVVGGGSEKSQARSILALCPTALDLTGATTVADVAALAAQAWGAVGNDTGPMHLVALTGCRCLALFCAKSDPARAAPMGTKPGQIRVLWVRDLALLSVQRVAAALW